MASRAVVHATLGVIIDKMTSAWQSRRIIGRWFDRYRRQSVRNKYL